jgi:hypothetical protein
MLLCLSSAFFGSGDEVGDLFGEVLRTGVGPADGGGDTAVASSEADEPDSVRGRPWELAEPVSIAQGSGDRTYAFQASANVRLMAASWQTRAVRLIS